MQTTYSYVYVKYTEPEDGKPRNVHIIWRNELLIHIIHVHDHEAEKEIEKELLSVYSSSFVFNTQTKQFLFRPRCRIITEVLTEEAMTVEDREAVADTGATTATTVTVEGTAMAVETVMAVGADMESKSEFTSV